MAETPISGLPEGADLTGDELLPIVQNGVTRRIFINKLKQVCCTDRIKSHGVFVESEKVVPRIYPGYIAVYYKPDLSVTWFCIKEDR